VRERGGLYLADEVQPGFGRTGTWWGYERHGLTPDLAILGKPMGNGHPVAAVVTTLEIAQSVKENGFEYFNTVSDT
jgi:4-aminobutyrate aminotransferase-like enzyme